MPYGTPPGLRSFATENVAGPASALQDAFGDRNTAVGFNAGRDAGDAAIPRTADDNTFFGHSAGQDCQVSGVVAIGANAASNGLPFNTGVADTTLPGTVAIGRDVLSSLVNWGNAQSAPVVIGDQALASFVGQPGVNGSQGVTIIGGGAAESMVGTAGGPLRWTTIVGADAMAGIPDGVDFCTAIGTEALGGISASGQPQNSTAVGARALRAVTSGIDNVAIGYGAGAGTTTGQRNTIVGTLALGGSVNADFCTIVGYGSGGAGSADFNTVVGAQSGAAIAGGDDYNTFIGYANATVATLTTGNLVLGALAATQNIPVAANRLYIEQAVTSCLHGDMVDGNLILGPSQANRAWGAGTAVLKIQDGTAPSANPVAGGYLYHTNAVGLNFRGAAGTITNLAPP